jgi:hypothetical protein
MSLATPACLIPPDETARLRSLHTHRLLQAPPERVFSVLVTVSARLFDLPVSLLALVDAEHVVYKALYGVAKLPVYPRAATFCALVVQQSQSVILPDLAQAPPASLLPTAAATAQAAGVRFYAGAPLRLSDERTVGTLCVLGYTPRRFSVAEQQLLESIAAVLGLMMTARHTCLSQPELGWSHWEVLEEQLAEAACALVSWLAQLRTPVRAGKLVPAWVLKEVLARLAALRQLLQDYQPSAVG